MADASAVPPLPPKGELVDTSKLQAVDITSLWRGTLAFGGMRNPGDMWSMMLRGDGGAIPLYRELEAKDEDVANGIDTLKIAVHGREHAVHPPAGDESSLAAEVVQFVQQQLYGLPDFDAVIDRVLDSLGYGFSVSEFLFDSSMGQASLLDIKDCPQELFLFGNRFQPQVGPLQLLDGPYAGSGAEVPEQKFLIHSYRPVARNRMGSPLLRSVFWPSWFKRNIQRLWLRYAEKGPGTAVTRYADGASDMEKQNAANIAQALVDSAAVALPENMMVDMELLKVARSMEPAVYEHLYEALQMNIVRRILGETLTSFGGDKGKGTQALGEVHSDTLEKKAISICKAVSGCFNRQLVRPLVLWNFGPNAPMPWWGYETGQAEDLDKALERDQTLQTMGLPIGQAYLYKRYGVPQPAPDELLAQRAPTQVATAIPTTADVTFAERNQRLANQRQADREIAEFDRLADGLKDEAIDLLAERVRQIAGAIQQ